MQEFLKKFKDYQGTNIKLQAFAKQLECIEDNYNDMCELLEEKLDEQEQEDNRSYSQNRTHHGKLYERGLFE